LVSDRARPHGGLVRTLTLSRPDRRNALDPEHLARLVDAFDAAEADPLVRAVVLQGEGKAFCAGWDLSHPFDPADPDGPVRRAMARVRACALPVVARVEGAAFGAGLELAISADLRVAGPGASFCLPPAKLGIAYAPEGLARLVALVGTAAARRMVFGAGVVDAQEALRIGLVDALSDEPEAHVARLVDALADTAPLAVRMMKRTLDALEPAMPPDARAAMEPARQALFASQDAAEGLAAMVERRPAKFLGR
jgi:enoyl-CoA hydratase/carnithine racemase